MRHFDCFQTQCLVASPKFFQNSATEHLRDHSPWLPRQHWAIHLWALMRAGYRLIGFVHDEFMIELKIGTDYTAAANDIERICCQTMAEFTPGVKISTEYALADRWSKEAKTLVEDGELQVWSPSQTQHE